MAKISDVYRPVFERATTGEFVRLCESCVKKYAAPYEVGRALRVE
jgi:hypothetical protein